MEIYIATAAVFTLVGFVVGKLLSKPKTPTIVELRKPLTPAEVAALRKALKDAGLDFSKYDPSKWSL